MGKQKGFVIPLIISIIAILAIGGGLYFYKTKKADTSLNNPVASSTVATSTLVGGDRDVHGCIGSAGYSWCQVKNKCLRTWEEKCEATSTATSKFECQTDNDCREVSCTSGGFAHELCNEGKCTISDEVKNKCSTPIKTSCTPKWTCGWTPCTNGYQGMTAVDSNNCGVPLVGFQIACPALARECTSPVAEPNTGASESSFCGGIAGIRCASGLTCKYDGTYPDAGGKCISEI